MVRKQSRRDLLKRSGVGLLVSSGIAGCLGGANQDSTTDGSELIVGSKNFTENTILGYMTYELLGKNTDMQVADRTNFGNNAETFDGFLDRDFHTYWDYVGTLWLVHEPENEESIEDVEEQYQAVKEQMEREHDLRILDRTSFENSYIFFASPEFVSGTGIETLSDLAAVVNDGRYDIRVAIENDFAGRNDGWPALTDHYGFEPQHLDTWEQQGNIRIVDPGLGYSELRLGNVDIALGYSTNAQLEELDVVFIEDDLSFWPHYHLVPVLAEERVSDPVVEEMNRLPDVLDSAKTMQRLNARVDIEGDTPQQVARAFLRSNALI